MSACPQGAYSPVKEAAIPLTVVVSSPEKGHSTPPGGQLRLLGDAEALMAGRRRMNWGDTGTFQVDDSVEKQRSVTEVLPQGL